MYLNLHHKHEVAKMIWTFIAILIMFLPYKLQSSRQFFSAQFLMICTHVVDYHYISIISRSVLDNYGKSVSKQERISYNVMGYVAESFYWILILIAIASVTNLLTLEGTTFRFCKVSLTLWPSVKVPLYMFLIFEIISIVVIDIYVNSINTIKMREG